MVTQDFSVVPLEGFELVLGLAWLDTHGDVLANFRKSKLIICQKGQWSTLLGDPKLWSSDIGPSPTDSVGGGDAFLV